MFVYWFWKKLERVVEKLPEGPDLLFALLIMPITLFGMGLGFLLPIPFIIASLVIAAVLGEHAFITWVNKRTRPVMNVFEAKMGWFVASLYFPIYAFSLWHHRLVIQNHIAWIDWDLVFLVVFSITLIGVLLTMWFKANVVYVQNFNDKLKKSKRQGKR